VRFGVPVIRSVVPTPPRGPPEREARAPGRIGEEGRVYGRCMKISARHGRRPPRQRSRKRRLLGVAISVLPEVIVLWRRGYPPAGLVVVRCRDGHLFTTICVPGRVREGAPA